MTGHVANEAERPLIMWTIYDNPKDYPGLFVARMFKVWRAGPEPTAEVVMSRSLDEVRRAMTHLGLTCIQRSPDDDPKILEIWL